MKQIGLSTNIKDAMNMIDEGSHPVVSYNNGLYLLSSSLRNLGSLEYTRFTKDGIAEYSIRMPFSFADTIGILLHKGDNLRPKMDSVVNELPVSVISSIYSNKPADKIG